MPLAHASLAVRAALLVLAAGAGSRAPDVELRLHAQIIGTWEQDLSTLTADQPFAEAIASGRVHETPEDMIALGRLLDRSYASAGPHLRRIITPERRVDAAGLVEQLTGMRLLAMATVTRDGRPIVGPVDGVFYRGSFHFGTAADAVRFRHLRARPDVSATHVPGDEFAVTVHGRALPVDVTLHGDVALRRALLDVYVPRYGPEWVEFLDSGPIYSRIEAERMFTFQMRHGG